MFQRLKRIIAMKENVIRLNKLNKEMTRASASTKTKQNSCSRGGHGVLARVSKSGKHSSLESGFFAERSLGGGDSSLRLGGRVSSGGGALLLLLSTLSCCFWWIRCRLFPSLFAVIWLRSFGGRGGRSRRGMA